ncbi:unnamed protein product, partial [Rotaria socialis]
MRHGVRSYSTFILIFTTIASTSLALHLYRKNSYRKELTQNISSAAVVQPKILATSITATATTTTTTTTTTTEKTTHT